MPIIKKHEMFIIDKPPNESLNELLAHCKAGDAEPQPRLNKCSGRAPSQATGRKTHPLREDAGAGLWPPPLPAQNFPARRGHRGRGVLRHHFYTAHQK